MFQKIIELRNVLISKKDFVNMVIDVNLHIHWSNNNCLNLSIGLKLMQLKWARLKKSTKIIL